MKSEDSIMLILGPSYYWLLFILVYNGKHQVEQEK